MYYAGKIPAYRHYVKRPSSTETTTAAGDASRTGDCYYTKDDGNPVDNGESDSSLEVFKRWREEKTSRKTLLGYKYGTVVSFCVKRPLILKGFLLRDRLKNSNYVLLKIPIKIHNLGHGQKLICIDAERLPEELGVTEQDVESLSQAGLVCRWPQKPRVKPRIDYSALQQKYRRMLDDSSFASQADLARHLGGSRAWVSKVLDWSKESEQNSRRKYQVPN